MHVVNGAPGAGATTVRKTSKNSTTTKSSCRVEHSATHVNNYTPAVRAVKAKIARAYNLDVVSAIVPAGYDAGGAKMLNTVREHAKYAHGTTGTKVQV